MIYHIIFMVYMRLQVHLANLNTTVVSQLTSSSQVPPSFVGLGDFLKLQMDDSRPDYIAQQVQTLNHPFVNRPKSPLPLAEVILGTSSTRPSKIQLRRRFPLAVLRSL